MLQNDAPIEIDPAPPLPGSTPALSTSASTVINDASSVTEVPTLIIENLEYFHSLKQARLKAFNLKHAC